MTDEVMTLMKNLICQIKFEQNNIFKAKKYL